MKNLMLVLALVLLTAGCEMQMQENAKANVHKIVYIRDNRTGICFAWCRPSGHTMGLATVPCEKVPKELLHESQTDL